MLIDDTTRARDLVFLTLAAQFCIHPQTASSFTFRYNFWSFFKKLFGYFWKTIMGYIHKYRWDESLRCLWMTPFLFTFVRKFSLCCLNWRLPWHFKTLLKFCETMQLLNNDLSSCCSCIKVFSGEHISLRKNYKLVMYTEKHIHVWLVCNIHTNNY